MTKEKFELQFTSKLNTSQKEAVKSVDGATLLLAVPGSGKTTVLVTRLGYMTCCKNIKESSILTMTYTVAATKEMEKRFSDMFGDYVKNNVEFRTINGISSIIINYYSRNHGKGEPFELVVNDGELTKILREIYIEINEEYPLDSVIKDIRTGITYIKNMMLTQEEIEKLNMNNVKNMQEIYNKYCMRLKKNRQMDYDDQMIYAFNILKGFPQVSEYFQNKYHYICVDESQDTSKIQHEIIKLLVNKNGNLFMVGDEDQSIYGFRAAYPEALMNFTKEYKNGKILFMEENYRSTKEIIAAANAFVSNNRFRYEKTIKATRDLEQRVQTIKVNDRVCQYKYIYCIAKKCVGETAVLYRNNDSALPLIDMLEREKIPYNCKKFDEVFFSNIVVKDVSDIINFAYNPHDCEVFMRIYYKFGFPLSKKMALNVCERSEKTGKAILEELQKEIGLKKFIYELIIELKIALSKITKSNAENAVQTILEEVKYREYAEDKKFDTGKLFVIFMIAKHEDNAENLIKRLDKLKEILRNHRNDVNTKFMLSTVHSSKGLEYEEVYLLDVLDGIIPYITESEADNAEDIKAYEEERRLYYVAMTRAKNKLYLFNCKGSISSFTSEIMSVLPKEIVNENDLFASLKKDLCGKTYENNKKSKAVVIGQLDDELLIEYQNRDIELLGVSEMFKSRNKEILCEDVKVKAKKIDRKNSANENLLLTSNIKKGSFIIHKTLGKGIVAELNGDSIEIAFKDKPAKRFSLNICLEKGLFKI